MLTGMPVPSARDPGPSGVRAPHPRHRSRARPSDEPALGVSRVSRLGSSRRTPGHPVRPVPVTRSASHPFSANRFANLSSSRSAADSVRPTLRGTTREDSRPQAPFVAGAITRFEGVIVPSREGSDRKTPEIETSVGGRLDRDRIEARQACLPREASFRTRGCRSRRTTGCRQRAPMAFERRPGRLRDLDSSGTRQVAEPSDQPRCSGISPGKWGAPTLKTTSPADTGAMHAELHKNLRESQV